MNDNTNGNGILGTIVSWSVPKEVPIARLREAMGVAGIDQELVSDMSSHRALKRAFNDMKKDRVIRQVNKEDGKITFQFTKEYKLGDHLEYDRECFLYLHSEHGIITTDGPEEIANEARRLLRDHMDKRNTGDLTRLVQSVFKKREADLIPIRDQGGVYFVPSMHTDLVHSTRILLSEIGGRLRSFDVRLGGDETQKSVAESLSDYLIGLINEYRESCCNITDETSQSVVSRRLVIASDLRRRLECYKGLLTGYAERLNNELGQAEQELLEKIASPAVEEKETASV